MKDKILSLRKEGKTYAEISVLIGLSQSTISYHIGNKNPKKQRVECKNCLTLIISSKTFCDRNCNLKFLRKVKTLKFKEGRIEHNNDIRVVLIDLYGNNCSLCLLNADKWNNKKLTLHVDHIDGDSDNNKENNLRLVCPNCHSQLETSKTRVKKETKRNKYLRNYKQQIVS